MQFVLGQPLIWHRRDNFSRPKKVTVVVLRSRGQAKLSNGWTVDRDGEAEGTMRVRGGYVTEDTEARP